MPSPILRFVALLLLGLATAATAAPSPLPFRERASLEDRLLAERLDTIVPALMGEQKIDMWVLIAREYVEDPVVLTMLDAENMHARRRTILVFFDPGGAKPIERLTVSRYGLAGLFQPAWNPDQEPDQWRALALLIANRDPAAEMKVYPQVLALTHAIIAEALSDKVITPGKTTANDVRWWMREKVSSLGLQVWFHPSLSIFRQGQGAALQGDEIIRQGDMLWTDFGITYLGLNSDVQQLGYVLKDGERDAPRGLQGGLAAANRLQDILIASFRTGLTGNQILAAARAKAIAAGLKPSIYSHPIGFHGHGAGSSIGFWDNQNTDPKGERSLRPNTAWSIELSAKAPVPEWNGQEVEFRQEENAFFDGNTVRYIDGRQTEFHLIRSGREAAR
jgi:hypothetical protein